MRTRISFGFSFIISIIFIITACSETDNKTSNQVPEASNEFVSDTLRPDNITFPEFEDPAISKILEGIQLCTSDSSKTDSLPLCNHKFFRVFKFNPNLEWEDGFLVEIRAGLFSKERQTLCIYHVRNRFRIVNQYLGVILEIITQPDGFSDLLMGYEDPEVGTVAIKHVWKNDQYKPVEVMEINNRFVKEIYKDSLKKVYIHDFMWGR